jgi:hypothetical protein
MSYVYPSGRGPVSYTCYSEHGSSIWTYGANHGNDRGGARKGRTMNTKENFYIYQFNHISKLIQEQKHTKEGDHQNSLFDIAVKLTPT